MRGLHFQREKTQAKLVRCISGQVWDVVVDLRKSSPTFKQWLSFELTGDNYKELFIPYGCAHGFLALQPSLMVYKCSENFYPEYDSGIRWNDEEIAVDWPLARTGGRVILSDKDENLPKFSEFVDRYGAF